ncbi:hypothetical protein SLE2022_337100 [Rubroshorea leprosula]
MVHSAYDCFQLLGGVPTKIDAIESYGSKLFLGCSDGSLRIYAPDFSGAELSSSPSDQHLLRKEQYAMERTVVGFSKKPIVSNYCSVLLLYVRQN